MTDYVKSTNFASKDSLASGNPLKIVKGTEIDTEFNSIATAVATKADLNSPTLVTPNIGTPSAGVLTNATGLPLTTGITGTLLVGNGGTGVTSITSGSLIKGNGTAAFTAATAAEIVSAIGSTAVTNATNATTAGTVSTTVASGATGTTQANTDNSSKIATTAYVQNISPGWNQTWQDVTTSRAIGTTYTNNTGKPIQVSISINTSSNNYVNAYFYAGGIKISAMEFGGSTGTRTHNIYAIIPAGASYYVTGGWSSGSYTVLWAELR